MDWAMAGLQNIAVVLFSLFAVGWLTSEGGKTAFGRPMLFACVAAFLAVCSSANGFLLAPVGSIYLLSRRTYRRLVVWNGLFALSLWLYLFHYQPTAHGTYDLAAAGLFFVRRVRCTIPAAAGSFIVLAILVAALFARFDSTSPAYFYSAMWVLASIGLIAVVRGSQGSAISSRYTIYPQLLLVYCYAFLMSLWRREQVEIPRTALACIAVGCAVLFVLFDKSGYARLRHRHELVGAGIDYYRADPSVHSPLIDASAIAVIPAERAEDLRDLNAAITQGVYSLPEPSGPTSHDSRR